jgi:hypothetical protein
MLSSFLLPWFEKCKEIDPDFVLYPWKEEDHKGPNRLPVITTAAAIPKIYSAARKYFNNLKEMYEGGPQHLNVWIGFQMPQSELRANLQSWLTHTQAGIYDPVLQIENTSLVGWLMFLTGQTNVL